MLGSSNSGKSTFLKSLRSIFLLRDTPQTLQQYQQHYIPLIRANILDTLLAVSNRIQETHDSLTVKMRRVVERVETMKDGCDNLDDRDLVLLQEDVDLLFTVFDRSVDNIKNSVNVQLAVVDHYIPKLQVIFHQEYLPTIDDIAYCRTETTAIVEHPIQINDNNIVFIDIDGQASVSEPSKWMHLFENVQIVLYMIDISDYLCKVDPHLYALEVADKKLKDYLMSPFSNGKDIILLLNKSDIFERSIEEVDLSVCFPDYDGGPNIDNAVNYLVDHYTAIMDDCLYDQNEVYINVTSVSDTDMVVQLWKSVTNCLVNQSLKSIGI
eukprot:TRINITY_DN1733_c0_g1_i4.p1 TRINITY_DN1733_c0_g1~~TRINITY_DN1733_c0_g1_i4.p1  ORF type:complete len:324 (+),score=57.76 TRINITY_DN1733_c0_g1_i4:97-1068(+)